MRNTKDGRYELYCPVCELSHIPALPISVADFTKLVRRFRAEHEHKVEDVCHWKYFDLEWDFWEGECGTNWTMEGTPSENDMIYCPGCGRKLVEATEEEE